MAEPTKKPAPVVTGSPAAGCAIFVTGAVGILVLIAWFVYAGFRQSREIKEFTAETAQTLTLAAPAPEMLAAVQGKIATYAGAIGSGTAATLTLTVDELNALLGGDPSLAGIRGMIRVDGIDTTIRTTVSLPVKPLLSQQRYLNGVIEMTPDIHKDKGLHLATSSISVPGHTVSQGFSDLYKQMDFLDDMILKGYREDAKTSAVIKQTTAVSCAASAVTLRFAPAGR
ncbi:MAG: hypothetical protein KA004_13295 [Verrucomicrobiales bacterium]|nr:hypothetical protein [Verrucomicrobiales bacterium]